MATMQEKMAESLAAMKAYQDAHGDNLVIHGADVLGRTHTERLVDAGYLTMVLRGWYIPSFPGSDLVCLVLVFCLCLSRQQV